jgi:hypothetical protein
MLMTDGRNSTGGSLTGWTCGHCGDLITRIEDGWVEWIASEDASGNEHLSGFRLVHRQDDSADADRRCQYDRRLEFAKDHSIVEGLSLERFVGIDGRMLLLSFLAQSSVSTREILELTKRVQIPGYELVRQRIYPAFAAGYLRPAISEQFPLQSEIAGVRATSI